jgi:hypothetical protein
MLIEQAQLGHQRIFFGQRFPAVAIDDTKASGLTRRTKPGSPLWFSTTSICWDVTPFPFLNRSAEVSSGPFETPEDPLEEAA